MDVLIKVAQLIVCLSLLVIVHEFGHFIFAKIFKTRVEKFYLFFNPWFSLFKFRIGETEYGMGWIPFGGYVKIAGMIDESMDKEQMKQPPKPYEFRSKPAWQRLLIMVGGVLMNILTAFIIYVGLSYTYGESYIANKDVKDGYVFSELAHEMGFRDGDKVLNIDGVSYDNESYSQIPYSMIIDDVDYVEVEREGEKIKIKIDKKFIPRMLEKGAWILDLRMPFVVDSVVNGSAAHLGGIVKGDSLIAFNGVPMKYRDQYTAAFKEHAGDTVELTLLRDSANMTITKVRHVIVPDSAIIGVLSAYRYYDYKITEKKYSFWEAIPAGMHRAGEQMSSYVKQLKMIFTPETEAYKSVGSVVAMGNFFPSTWNWLHFWNITALFSVMLAVMNILPIPALDGGHVVFLLYEVITRRKPSDRFMEIAQTIGMFLLLALMVLALGNDIFRLFQ